MGDTSETAMVIWQDKSNNQELAFFPIKYLKWVDPTISIIFRSLSAMPHQKDAQRSMTVALGLLVPTLTYMFCTKSSRTQHPSDILAISYPLTGRTGWRRKWNHNTRIMSYESTASNVGWTEVLKQDQHICTSPISKQSGESVRQTTNSRS